MPSNDFRRFLDAAARGYTGGYDRFRTEGYAPRRISYSQPNLDRPGYRAEHLAPLSGGSTTANLTRFAAARGKGFECSYVDFLDPF